MGRGGGEVGEWGGRGVWEGGGGIGWCVKRSAKVLTCYPTDSFGRHVQKLTRFTEVKCQAKCLSLVDSRSNLHGQIS